MFSFVAIVRFKEYQSTDPPSSSPSLNDAIVRLAILSVLALMSALTEVLALLLLTLAVWGWRRTDYCMVSGRDGEEDRLLYGE